MKKILLGLLVAGAVGGVAMLATNAFFSDTETSTGNTFQAGKLDLKVSSTCHYDGMVCSGESAAAKVWQEESAGSSTYPQLLQQPCSCTWMEKDITAYNNLFFNFKDIKPGDYGENTVDFKVVDNPAWMCANLHATDLGNLYKYLSVVWWVDNGDNKLGAYEKVLYDGPRTIQQWFSLPGVTNNTLPLTFADSYLNWLTWPGPTPPNTTPIPGNVTQYMGIGWCFGNMVLTPGTGIGFTCSGIGDQNDAQGTSVVADLSFNVEQFRNNPTFRCPENVNKGP